MTHLTSLIANDTLLFIPIEEGDMKVSVKEYRQGRFRLRAYWKNERIQKYRNKRGEILEGKVQAFKAAVQMDQEIQDKVFDPSEWSKAKPFLLKNAFQVFQKAKQCQEEWRYARARVYRNHIGPEIGEMDIREFTTVHVNQFHGHLIDKGLKEKTIKNVLGILHSILNFNRVGDKIKWPTIEVQREAIKWLNVEQQEAVMKYLDEKDLPIFRFLQITGCRSSEASSLLREDVDWKNGIVYVRRSMGLRRRIISHTKTHRIKPVPIQIFGTDTHILKPTEVTPFIFSRDGRPYHRQRLQRAWMKANKIAREAHGIPMIHVKNAFRHSMASQLINAGVPIEAISKMLGHSSIKMTESIYANILPETAWGWRKVVPISPQKKEESG